MVNLLFNMAHITSLSVSSYNWRGFNELKKVTIADLCVKTDFVLLQELWLAEQQLVGLGLIKENVSYTAVAGFDNSIILTGRPAWYSI
jgi:hypothetical protein